MAQKTGNYLLNTDGGMPSDGRARPQERLLERLR